MKKYIALCILGLFSIVLISGCTTTSTMTQDAYQKFCEEHHYNYSTTVDDHACFKIVNETAYIKEIITLDYATYAVAWDGR